MSSNRRVAGRLTLTALEFRSVPAVLFVSDVSLPEGDSVIREFSFTVSLDEPVGADVAFAYAAAGSEATAPWDFARLSGTGLIPAGQREASVAVLVEGDRVVEPDETFRLDVRVTDDGGQGVVPDPTRPSVTLTDLGRVPVGGSAGDVRVVGDRAYVAAGSAGLVVWDVSDPAAPTVIGSFDTPGSAEGLEVVGSRVFIADRSEGLAVLDAADPTRIRLLGSFDTFSASDVVVRGGIAYVVEGPFGLTMLDVSNPAAIRQVGSYDEFGIFNSVDIADGIAFIANSSTGVVAVDVTNPSSPRRVGAYEPGGFVDDVKVRGGVAYVTGGGDGSFAAVDVTDPTNMRLLDAVSYFGGGEDIRLEGDPAYVASFFGLQVVDVSDPRDLRIVGEINPPGVGYAVDLAGDVVLLAASTSGVTLLSREIGTSGRGTILNDDTGPNVQAVAAVLTDGSELDLAYPAIQGRTIPFAVAGLRVTFDRPVSAFFSGALSLTGPGTPLIVGTEGTRTETLTWRFAAPMAAGELTATLIASAFGVEDLFGNPIGSDGDALTGRPYVFGLRVLAGDVTGDGRVDATDVRETFRVASGLPASVPSAFADIDRDGDVDAADLLAVRRRLGTFLP